MKRRETFKTLFSDTSVKIKKIVSPKSFRSAIFTQSDNEFVFMLKGSATLSVGGKKVFLRKNHSLFIPKKTAHRILSTSAATKTEWLAIHIK
ncbi:MAG: cupin domain-containing protein [Patescibacteria group bacterium]|nr:cupin domain-containing protein [bacterium]MDZ4240841.1 cupin domain-containing protein [Patescibacteria group bacterium]